MNFLPHLARLSIVKLAEIAIIASEIGASIRGGRFSKILRISRFEFAMDFDAPDSRFLYVNLEPSDPRCYLIRRRYRDLDKASLPPSPFSSLFNKLLAGSMVESVKQIDNERVIEIVLKSEFGEEPQKYGVAAQLTGRSANLFLMDDTGIIIDSANFRNVEGQRPGDHYSAPKRLAAEKTPHPIPIIKPDGASYSEMLDTRYSELAEEKQFENLAASARKQFEQKLSKSKRLAAKLRADLATHGDPENWKRIGEMLLANPGARREGNFYIVTDYYDPNLSELPVEAIGSETPAEIAQKHFKRYSRAKSGLLAITGRLAEIKAEIQDLEARRKKLEESISKGDIEAVSEFVRPAKPSPRTKPKQKETAGFARKFVSVDGFEILVGKKAKDNDYLTFREARSNDLWLHAADYPGSHVIIRNPNRRDIPHPTILEAASLAAFYSKGKKQPKAAVNYTQKKFVNKPRGAQPGLVRLASFKTILVEPKPPRSRED